MASRKSSSSAAMASSSAKGGKGKAAAKPKTAAPIKTASTRYLLLGGGLYGKLMALAADLPKGKVQVIHLRYHERNGPAITCERTGNLTFKHPDNKKNEFAVTADNLTSAMQRARHDYELAQGKQPNYKIKGMGAKEGFAKNVEPNNVAYSDTGEIMHKWKSATYWGDNDKRGTSGTVNEIGFDFKTKTIKGSKEGTIKMETGKGGFSFSESYDKHDFNIANAEREVHEVSDDDSEEEDEEMAEEEVEDDSADSDDSDDEDDANSAGNALAAVNSVPVAPPVAQVALAKDLTLKQIKGIVKAAAGANKAAVKLSALELGSLAQLKNIHKRVGLGASAATDRDALAATLRQSWAL